MHLHHVIILGLTVAALVGGLLLLPRPEEQVTMLFRDGRFDSALRELDTMYKGGDRRPHIVSQLAAGHANSGRPETAIALLGDYIAGHPRDVTARLQIAKLYLSTQRWGDYLNALEVSMSLRPSAGILRKLLGLYRLNGRFDAEERLLVRYLGTPYLQYRDFERAGALLAARGELSEAARALALADDRLPVREETARLLLFDVLVRDARPDEAAENAVRWVKVWRKSYHVMGFVERFARDGYDKQALTLLNGVRDDLPHIDTLVARVLGERGYAKLALHVTQNWADRLDGSDERQVQAYMAAARDFGDPAGPYRLLRRAIAARAPPEVQAAMAEALAATFGLKALAPFRVLLSPDVLTARPVFAAELALAEGNPLLAQRLLGGADPRVMTAKERVRWLTLFKSVAPDAVVFQRVSALWRANSLPTDLLPSLAQLALALGRTQDHDAIWKSLGRSGT